MNPYRDVEGLYSEEMLEKLPFHTAPSARTAFRRALVAGDEIRAKAAEAAAKLHARLAALD